jgi:hypothetical protein
MAAPRPFEAQGELKLGGFWRSEEQRQDAAFGLGAL